MDYEQEKLLYQLYKKGKANLSPFDKLLIEANPEIKHRLAELFGVDQEFYAECNHIIEESLAGAAAVKTRTTARRFRLVPLLAIPASLAACLLLVLRLVMNLVPVPVALGGKVVLLLSAEALPERFYRTGSSLPAGTELKLEFQVPAAAAPIRQGIVFSVSSTESRVYYRFDGKQGGLNQREPVTAAGKLLLPAAGEYIGFVACFSATPFAEQALIENITAIIRRDKAAAGKVLEEKYKADALDYIFLVPEQI